MIDPLDLSKRIIFEDNHLIAVNKRPSWLVQGDRTGDISLVDALKDYIKVKYNKPGEVFLGSIHRLDRPVSGLVVFARTSKALERMNALFAGRDIQKTYLAITEGRPPAPSATLRHFLLKDNASNTVRVVKPSSRNAGNAKEAVLEYSEVSQHNLLTMLKVLPRTGRPHQIRVQLASMNCVILGDVKYGARGPLPDKSIALHSYSLEFLHPVRKELLKIVAPIPGSEWWNPFSADFN